MALRDPLQSREENMTAMMEVDIFEIVQIQVLLSASALAFHGAVADSKMTF